MINLRVRSHASGIDDCITAPGLLPPHIDWRAGGDGQILKRQSPACSGPGEHDKRLAQGQLPSLGAHVVTPRRGYTHHGIYVGCGKVVQYGGLASGLRSGPVEEVHLTRFTLGYPLWVRAEGSGCFDGDEVVRRARSRIGESRYHLLTNNCEHFCEWCLRDEHRSYQVDDWLSRPRRVLQMTIELAAKLLTVPPARQPG